MSHSHSILVLASSAIVFISPDHRFLEDIRRLPNQRTKANTLAIATTNDTMGKFSFFLVYRLNPDTLLLHP